MCMGDLMRLTGLISILLPLLLFICLRLISVRAEKTNRIIQIVLLGIYCCAIIYYTLFRKSVGSDHQINMTPFWSYGRWNQLAVRWQVYMNIFLFIPFGFMLKYALDWSFIKVLLIGLLFSVVIEIAQFVFCLGLCEFDDVFHGNRVPGT